MRFRNVFLESLIFTFGALLLLTQCTKGDLLTDKGVAVKYDTAKLMFNVSDTNYTIRKWQGIPTIEVLPNGDLYTSWYSGTNTEGVGNYITVSLSHDGGETWKKNVIVVAPPENARVFDPCLWFDARNNALCLYWAQCKAAVWDGEGGVWVTQMRLDGSQKWSKPKRLADGVMLNKPNIISNNIAVLPIAYWDKLTGSFMAPKKSGMVGANIYYELGSNTWMVGKIPIAKSEAGISEHQVVALNDGRLWALIRSKSGIYESYSSDSGYTWSNARAFTRIGATTPSRFHVRKLNSGRLLLVTNASNQRTNMSAFISDDDGETWPYKLLLDYRKNISYPDAAEDNKGNIYICYDRERATAKEILMVKVDEQAIMDSTNTTRNSLKPIVVDK